jgi:hypothetical protein
MPCRRIHSAVPVPLPCDCGQARRSTPLTPAERDDEAQAIENDLALIISDVRDARERLAELIGTVRAERADREVRWERMRAETKPAIRQLPQSTVH